MGKQSLMQRIHRDNLLSTIIFGVLFVIFLYILVLNKVVAVNKQRLLNLAEVYAAFIHRQRPSVLYQTDHPPFSRAVLKTELQSITSHFPAGFTAGFYSRPSDRVIFTISQTGQIRLTDARFPAVGEGFQPPFSLKPGFVSHWSPFCRNWLLQYSHPVMGERQRLLGYTFAQVTLTRLIGFTFPLSLGLVMIAAGAGVISTLTGRRLNAAIRVNLQQLLLLDRATPEPVYQFEEFDRIAHYNQRVFTELKVAEEQKVAILESISDAFFALDDEWRFSYLNRHMERISGWKREDILGKSLLSLFPQDKLEAYLPYVERVRASRQPCQLELEWQPGFWYEFHIYPAATGVAVYFQDISGRKSAEAELRRSQQQTAHLLESIHHAFFTLDARQRFTYINKAAERLFKTDGPTLIGASARDFFQANLEPIFVRELERAWREGAAVRFEVHSQRLEAWVEVFVYPADDGSFVYFLNITERKRAEEARLRLAAIVESSEDAIISTDLDCKIVSWNRGAERIYGYPPEQIIGQSITLLYSEVSGTAAMTVFQRWLRSGMKGTFESVMRHRNGAPVNVAITLSVLTDGGGRVIGYSGIHRDISKEKDFAKELAAERERLFVTLRSIGEGVIATDCLGRIMLMNREAENLTGYSQYGVLDQELDTVFSLVNSQTKLKYAGIVAAVLNSEEIIHLNYSLLLHKSQREIPVSVSLAPIKSGAGECFGVVLIFQDISNKLRTEQELVKAEKLESLGILAGGIAHDFNNFLSAILANLQLAMAKLKRGEDIGRYLRESADATRKASDLTKQLLTFSRGEAPVKKTAAISELIQDTVNFVLRGSKVRVRFELPADLWPVEIDSGQISQVLHNLTLNAKQAMPGGGTLTIGGQNRTVGPGARFIPGRYVGLVIQDEGAGIPPEHLGRIFDPFFTTKKEGTGLGLATSYAIVKKHNGYIEVESEPGRGTAFSIFLPATDAVPVQEEEALEVAAAREARILLMDDDTQIRFSVGEMLSDAGYQVQLAQDGWEAVSCYRQAMTDGRRFDAVIMDLTVPGGLGGQETIAELKTLDPQVKAIVSSGYFNDPIIAEYQKYGFCGVVAKPYKFAELKRVIDRVLG